MELVSQFEGVFVPEPDLAQARFVLSRVFIESASTGARVCCNSWTAEHCDSPHHWIIVFHSPAKQFELGAMLCCILVSESTSGSLGLLMLR